MAIRNRVVWILVALLLAGCATLSVGSAQEQCEKRHAAFPDVVTCLKDAVASGSASWGGAYINLSSKPTPELKLYLLKAEQLSQQVQKGEISDLDARVALQQLYVDLSNQSSQQRTTTRTTTEPQKNGMSFLCKDAVARGDRGSIFVHCQ